MSRYMRETHTKAYRAVITRRYPTGSTSTFYKGPYASKAGATMALNYAKRWQHVETTGHIEETPFLWQPVRDEPGPGKAHTDSTGQRYVNSGDGSPESWLRIGDAPGNRWFAWAEIRDR